MKYCQNCGGRMDDNDSFCPYCGSKIDNNQNNINNTYTQKSNTEIDAPSAGFAILCFFFPTVGLILYLIWKDTMPLKAKSCGKGALISVICSAVVFLCYFIIWIILAFLGVSMI